MLRLLNKGTPQIAQWTQISTSQDNSYIEGKFSWYTKSVLMNFSVMNFKWSTLAPNTRWTWNHLITLKLM